MLHFELEAQGFQLILLYQFQYLFCLVLVCAQRTESVRHHKVFQGLYAAEIIYWVKRSKSDRVLVTFFKFVNSFFYLVKFVKILLLASENERVVREDRDLAQLFWEQPRVSFHQNVWAHKSCFRKPLQQKLGLMVFEGVAQNLRWNFIIPKQNMIICKSLCIVSINFCSQIWTFTFVCHWKFAIKSNFFELFDVWNLEKVLRIFDLRVFIHLLVESSYEWNWISNFFLFDISHYKMRSLINQKCGFSIPVGIPDHIATNDNNTVISDLVVISPELIKDIFLDNCSRKANPVWNFELGLLVGHFSSFVGGAQRETELALGQWWLALGHHWLLSGVFHVQYLKSEELRFYGLKLMEAKSEYCVFRKFFWNTAWVLWITDYSASAWKQS